MWISIYNAKCLTLDNYRQGRILFAGDAAHLVPIFGVRGLNSGLDDAANLAWKLAGVIAGSAPDTLLDTYSQERVAAARMNIAYGAKSTEFMAPPNYGFDLLREATLRLALHEESVRSLINPRQSEPVCYQGSALNLPDGAADAGDQAAPGMPAPECELSEDGRTRHLTEWFGQRFTVLVLGDDVPEFDAGQNVQVLCLGQHTAVRDTGQLRQRYGQAQLYLIRPDGYVMGRWKKPDLQALRQALASFGIRGETP